MGNKESRVRKIDEQILTTIDIDRKIDLYITKSEIIELNSEEVKELLSLAEQSDRLISHKIKLSIDCPLRVFKEGKHHYIFDTSENRSRILKLKFKSSPAASSTNSPA